MVILVHETEVDELGNAFVGQVWVHGPHAEAQKSRDLMHVPGFAALQDQGHRRPLPGLHQVLLHGRYRQQRRDRHMVLVHATVRENNDVGALGRGPVHGNVELGQGLLQGSVLVEQKRDDPRPEILPVQSLDGQKLYPGQDRRIQLQNTAVPALFLKKISVGAKVDRGVRHHLLPEGIDGRVRDLCEHLLEIVEQRLMMLRQHGDGHVVTHGSGGLDPVLRHGKDHVQDVLVAVAEDLVEAVAHGLGVDRDLPVRHRQILHLHQIAVQPFPVRVAPRVALLALLVGDDALLLRIHQKEPAGLQPGLLDDVLRVNVQDADLGREDQAPRVRHIVAGGPESVPVQGSSHQLAVGEKNGRRAVPGFHHGGIVVIEILLFLRHEAVVLPGLRDQHHHGQRKVHPVHGQEFQGVVQHGGIRPFPRDDRADPVHVRLQHRRVHRLLTGKHAVDVAADRVDLSVVCQHPVGMRPLPGGRRVGGEAGMDHRDGRAVIVILQIRIELPELSHQEHALVDDGPGGKRTDVGVLRALLKLPPDHEKPPVKGQPLFQSLRPADKALADVRHTVHCPLSQDLRMHRDLSPAQEGESLLLCDHLHHPHGKGSLHGVLRQIKHADAVVPGTAEADPLLLRRLSEKAVGDLQQNADAVADGAGRVLSCAVFQLFHDFQRVIQDAVFLRPVDIYDRADPAGVPLPEDRLHIRYLLPHNCLHLAYVPAYLLLKRAAAVCYQPCSPCSDSSVYT